MKLCYGRAGMNRPRAGCNVTPPFSGWGMQPLTKARQLKAYMQAACQVQGDCKGRACKGAEYYSMPYGTPVIPEMLRGFVSMPTQELELEDSKMWFVRFSLDARMSTLACGNRAGAVLLWDPHEPSARPRAKLRRPAGAKTTVRANIFFLTLPSPVVQSPAPVVSAC